MKKIKYIILFTIIFQFTGFAQVINDTILKLPKEWRYEKVSLPFGFTPKMTHKGIDELRFAPGMFNRDAEKYFTYAYVFTIENELDFDKKELEKLLNDYYKGLCGIVAKSKKLDTDVSKIKIDLNTIKNTKCIKAYSGEIIYFDTFNNGEQIILNTEIEILPNKSKNKTYIIGLVSPKQKEDKLWKELYNIRKNIKL